MDRNQLIGILLILAMLVGYQFLVPKPPQEKKTTAQQTTAKPNATSAVDNTAPAKSLDSAATRAQFGDFPAPDPY